jgi:hypothetical protein
VPGDRSRETIIPGAFFNLCSKIKINSKRLGPCPLIPIRTQRYVIEKVIEGLNAGIHQFVILKCRQACTTTILQAFTVYWQMRFPGVCGGFAIDDNPKMQKKNFEYRQMLGSLDPRNTDFFVPIAKETREMVALDNGSSMNFENANKREKGTLFRSIGLNFFHGSEVGFWNDPDGLLSLMSTFDDAYPHRLYLFESTAHGFNLFRKMCHKAQVATSARFIFIPWYFHDWYRIERSDELGRFERYWDGMLNAEEEEWVFWAKEHFDYVVLPEQIAWWRYMLSEEFMDNLEGLYQEYPPTPEHAFQYGGNIFFGAEELRQVTNEIESPSYTHPPKYFRFKFGKGLTDVDISPCEGRSGYYHLAVWDAPRSGEGVQYAMGVDPAHGMTERSDYSSIQVLRCYADGLEQVAEFAMRGISTKQLSYALLYLYAAYHVTDDFDNVMWTTELQGGGAAVVNEVEEIQQDLAGVYDKLGRHFDSLRGYTYKRIDSLTPGPGAKHWQTNERNKTQFLHIIKSKFESGSLIVRSLPLIQEMAIMLRSPDGVIESSEGKHEDLVMSLGIAVMIYVDHLFYELADSEYTIESGLRQRELLMRGATAGDLVSMRMFQWIREKRDVQAEREASLQEALSEFSSERH